MQNGSVSNTCLTESPNDVFLPTMEKVIQLNEWFVHDIFPQIVTWHSFWIGLLFKGKTHSDLQIVLITWVPCIYEDFQVPSAKPVVGGSPSELSKGIFSFSFQNDKIFKYLFLSNN